MLLRFWHDILTFIFANLTFNIHLKNSDVMEAIVSVLVSIIVVGVLLWLVNRFIPMESTIKSIFNIVVIILLVIWLLRVFGVWGSVHV